MRHLITFRLELLVCVCASIFCSLVEHVIEVDGHRCNDSIIFNFFLIGIPIFGKKIAMTSNLRNINGIVVGTGCFLFFVLTCFFCGLF
jgi:hypothetical protein